MEVLGELLPELDLVLIMSVEPGFGGQSFMEGSWEKVRRLRRMIDDRGLPVLIEIDGGVSASNAGDLFAAGCDALVAGSAVFGAARPEGGNREDAGGTVLPVTAAGAGVAGCAGENRGGCGIRRVRRCVVLSAMGWRIPFLPLERRV